MSAEVLLGDCRELMTSRGPFDMIIADPPYGDTSLEWDRRVEGWHSIASQCLKPTGSLWVFGSLRYFMAEGRKFEDAGLRYAQEIVWEKHNGSGFHADRFKRVHELAVQWYRKDAAWADVHNDVLVAVKDKIGIGHQVNVERNGIVEFRIAILPPEDTSHDA